VQALEVVGTGRFTTLGTGVGHLSGTGVLSSSLIVDADITSATITAARLNAGGTANRVLLTTDGAAASWGQVNLATSQVTGTLPAGNQASQTLAGDVTGTTAASTVVGLTGTAGVVSFASTIVNPTIKQADEAGATGDPFTIQAQNAVTTGGKLLLRGGTGGTTPGQIELYYNGTERLRVGNALVTLPNSTALTISGDLTSTTALADINGFRHLTFASSAISPTISQADEGGNTGDPLEIHGQNAVGGSSTGGPLRLKGGTGTLVNSPVELYHGGVLMLFTGTNIVTLPNSTGLAVSNDITASAFGADINGFRTISMGAGGAVTLKQADAVADHGQILTIQAQNANGTDKSGGSLVLKSGAKTGTGVVGNILLAPGGTTVVQISATEVTMSQTFLTFAGTVASPLISQAAPSDANGQIFGITAQSGVGTNRNGGPLHLFGGTPTGTGAPGMVSLVTTEAGGSLVSHTVQVASINGRKTVLNRQAQITSTEIPAGTGDLTTYIGNIAVAPTGNPVGGGILYCEGGALKFRGSAGTATTIANA
jgi:hypothetical protein